MIFLLADFEVIHEGAMPGHVGLTADGLAFYRRWLACFDWVDALFPSYHAGYWDTNTGPKKKDIKALSPLTDWTQFAGQPNVHFLSDQFSAEATLRYDQKHVVLRMAHQRLTICFPLWVLRNHEISSRYNLHFQLTDCFAQMVEQLLQLMADDNHFFLRRANLRVLTLPFRRYRPEFDYFYLADNALFEAWSTQRYSESKAMPAYMAQLATHPDFPGRERKAWGEYVSIQWATPGGWGENELAQTLSQRHIWIGRSGLVPRNQAFNVLADRRDLQAAVPVLKNGVFRTAGRKVFIVVSQNAQITEPEWQAAAAKVEEVRGQYHAGNVFIELVVANREQCFQYFRKMLRIRADNISYVGGGHLFTPFPGGMWLNDTHGEISEFYPAESTRLPAGVQAHKSKNYLLLAELQAIFCFKRQDDIYLPHWLLRGGSELTIWQVSEQADRLEINEGFGVGDLSRFEVRLSDGAILHYNESSALEVIRLHYRP